MKKEVQIQQLISCRKLSTNEEHELFEAALVKLQGNIRIEDVCQICKAFCDDTKDDEVMFGIIHLIEELQGNDYLKCIAICSPEMTEAHEWAMTLNKRILNSKKYFNNYISIIKELEKNDREKILSLLIDVKNDNPQRFEEKVNLILNEVNNDVV